MKYDALSVSPGLISNAPRFHAESVKAISYIEGMAAVLGRAPTQGKEFDTYLAALRTYLSSNSLIDSAAPTFVSAVINRAAAPRRITVTFSEPLDGSVTPAATAFVSSPAKTWASILVTGSAVVLEATTDWVAGATTIAYTQPGTNNLRDPSQNQVANVAAQSVTNNA